jgi:alanine-glyoxylate transaminase / serine-glyoxylate transaminase / serine-pyruvate transaminase
VRLSERLLMGPGPSNPFPEVAGAFARPLLGHLDPEFLTLLDEVCDRLRSVFQTANSLTLPLSGTGSAGMEAAFVNVVNPGDVVVVGVNGLFGERMCEVAGRLGADVVRVDAPWGEPLDPEVLLAAHPAPAVRAIVHAETSTGVRNDIEGLADGSDDVLLVVDTVTSLGGIEVDLDRWGVDIAYSGTQKCLGVPPGLSPITVSERGRSRFVARPSSWYLDLGLIAHYVESGDGSGRRYHHTAPVAMIFALHAALGALLDEGLEASWERHAICGTRLRNGLRALDIELVVPDGHHLPQLTTVRVPSALPGGMTEAGVRKVLLDRYGIEIGAGVGPMAGTAWRIGCMGHTAREGNVDRLLAALGEVLGR